MDNSAIVSPCVRLAKQSPGFNATCFPNHLLTVIKEASLCHEEEQKSTVRRARKTAAHPNAARHKHCNGTVGAASSEDLFKAPMGMGFATKPNKLLFTMKKKFKKPMFRCTGLLFYAFL